ncbi:LuxR family transcriptional regulator [Pukyongiella litopenaei]|uniref:LuxR family transcriptional regulator n=1 Tax=Pukyongiella litopenaei TaxID=2605946 RepID=A0A2S0MV16_9RHOB|nr:LuxR family transcriptional regulator [Pukyongiella litopenaei]AVO39647.1 LuxR family transcriptional regulator [Pukyongiella litopenaei]
MLQTLAEKKGAFYPGLDLDDAMDLAREILQPAGFDIVTYDFSPVPLTHDGQFILPTVLSMRGTPGDMEHLWCANGYYSRDPVMDAARQVTRPFAWSHHGRQSLVMRNILGDRHRPVVEYLLDSGMRSGITVPVRGPGGALATFSAIRIGNADDADLEEHLSTVGHLGYVLHDAVRAGFSGDDLRTSHVRFTPRERQCMMLCAQGLTTKQIAHEIDRSIPTVTLHLTSAANKLGARNRAHALALAAHYRLLEPDA